MEPGAPSRARWSACSPRSGPDYELRELSLRDDEQQGDEYAAVNPHRKVPFHVIDDGPPLTESVAILLTLDDHHPETALLPAKGTRD